MTKRFFIGYSLITFFLLNSVVLLAQYYGVADDKVKPLLKEYTDASHLLVPNQWYEIRIRVEKGITTYSVNDEELFRYTLAGGEGDGHFGLRLLQNHVLFTDFKATIL